MKQNNGPTEKKMNGFINSRNGTVEETSCCKQKTGRETSNKTARKPGRLLALFFLPSFTWLAKRSEYRWLYVTTLTRDV